MRQMLILKNQMVRNKCVVPRRDAGIDVAHKRLTAEKVPLDTALFMHLGVRGGE